MCDLAQGPRGSLWDTLGRGAVTGLNVKVTPLTLVRDQRVHMGLISSRVADCYD